jgi:hypothetical protein
MAITEPAAAPDLRAWLLHQEPGHGTGAGGTTVVAEGKSLAFFEGEGLFECDRYRGFPVRRDRVEALR